MLMEKQSWFFPWSKEFVSPTKVSGLSLAARSNGFNYGGKAL
jgi:hypothetical protein